MPRRRSRRYQMASPLNRGTTSMNTQAQLADRLRRWSVVPACRAIGAWMARLLSPSHAAGTRTTPRTPGRVAPRRRRGDREGRQRADRRQCNVHGVRAGHRRQRPLGGFAPGCVAAMASVLLVGAHGHSAIGIRRPNGVRARGSWRGGSRRRSQQPGAPGRRAARGAASRERRTARAGASRPDSRTRHCSTSRTWLLTRPCSS